MDRHERWEDAQEAFRSALDGNQAEMWTALPGIVQSFDANEGTVTVQPAIMGKLRKPDGSYSDITMPQLIHVPVHFQSGGGFTLTVPVKKGDECLVVFASRCIDGWWRDGGVQKQLEVRMHDLSDGFAILGTRSKKNALKNVSVENAQLRSDDGKTYLEVSNGTITIVAPTKVRLETPLLEVTGEVQAGAGTGDAVKLRTHLHGGVMSGGSRTAPPVAGT